MRHCFSVLFAGVVVAGLAACGGAKVTGTGAVAAPTAAPTTVYVTDFDLDASQVQQSGPGSLINRVRPGIIGSGPLGIARTPEQQARDLVDLMANSIVDDLHKDGIAAERMAPGVPLPVSGWLVRGVFLQVDAGNRVRRAALGFGAGATDLQVATSIDQLGAAAPQPLYTVDTNAQSGKLPGAVVTLNPYVAAARFVMAGKDLDRNAKDTAAKIADQVKTRVAAAQ
ncbi:MAG: DUF4410 domain-containing protein [Alphaproteobacteria bacterium]|nr:DUF4410 domain-containing protein [Alphaproteobacteria bacterium]MDE1969898.1 DUF4410 domain-containing protein [Alphaproteobacteria bacterium]